MCEVVCVVALLLELKGATVELLHNVVACQGHLYF